MPVQKHDIDLMPDLHHRLGGVIVGEGVSFQPHAQRMIAHRVKRMSERQGHLPFRRHGDARGAEPCAIDLQMQRDILPKALAVVFHPHPGPHRLTFGCHQGREFQRGNAKVFCDIVLQTEKRQRWLQALLEHRVQRGHRGAVGKGLPIRLLEIAHQHHVARAIARLVECRSSSLKGIVH